jgi:hypothetical protein
MLGVFHLPACPERVLAGADGKVFEAVEADPPARDHVGECGLGPSGPPVLCPEVAALGFLHQRHHVPLERVVNTRAAAPVRRRVHHPEILPGVDSAQLQLVQMIDVEFVPAALLVPDRQDDQLVARDFVRRPDHKNRRTVVVARFEIVERLAALDHGCGLIGLW